MTAGRAGRTCMQIPAARILFSDNDKQEISQRITTALGTGALTLGTNTREFESAFATAHAAPYAVAVSSGTAALEIILRSVDVAGRDVIVPSNTFYATGSRFCGPAPTSSSPTSTAPRSRSAPPPSKRP